MKLFRPFVTAISALGVMLSIPAVTNAQQEDVDVLEEIIVTATRMETALMKTPVAITVVDQDSLDRAGITSVSEMANMIPNMDIATINGQSTPIISMRGVRSTNETELGDPAVGVHLNGVYSPRMQGFLGMMFDNERVEVLRGPQGTLFGRNSTVGTINIITAKPSFDGIKAESSVGLGNWNARDFYGMLNLPLSDNFAVRLAGRTSDRDSYIKGYYDPNQYDQRLIRDKVANADVIATGAYDGSCTMEAGCYARTQWNNWWIDWVGGDNGWTGYDIRELVPADDGDFYMNTDEYAYRISAAWRPSDAVSVDLSYQKYRKDDAGGIDLVNCEKLRGRPARGTDGALLGYADDCSRIFPADDTYQAIVNVPGRLFLDIDYLRARVDWDLGDNMMLSYIGGSENQDRESAQDMEASLNAWDGSMFFLPGTGSESSSHELQLSSGGERLSWVAGANVFEETTVTKGYYDNPINDKAFWDQGDRSTEAWSAFAQGTYALNDQLNLTLGLRYSDETKQDVGGRTYTCTNDNGCAPGWWNRETLNALPGDAWWDTSVYPESSGNDNKGSWTHSDWRVGLDYDLTDETMVYAYVASGFKAGGIGDVFRETNPRTGELIEVQTKFDPEEVITYELGFKTSAMDGRLDLMGTYFFSDYTDMQYASVGAIAFTDRWVAQQNPDGTPILDENNQPVFGWETAPIIAYYTQNVPGADIQGIELEFDWTPYDGGRLWGYATWLDTEITKDWITKWNYDAVAYFGVDYETSIDPNNEFLITNLKGNELAVSPTFKANLNFTHNFELGSLGTLVPWVNVHWEDDSYLTIWNVDKHTDDMDFVIPDNEIRFTDDKRDSFYTVNSTVRFYRDNWYLEAYGYNLTDEVIQYWGGAAEGVAKGSFSAPRTYGLRFSINFD
jgi:iron complex outermembrane receptor protein